jgi:hypothetical protein
VSNFEGLKKHLFNATNTYFIKVNLSVLWFVIPLYMLSTFFRNLVKFAIVLVAQSESEESQIQGAVCVLLL